MTNRYGSYKSSGIAWIDVLPSHWEVKPLLAVARERDVRNTGLVEDNLLSLSYGSIVRKDISSNEGLLPESFETYQIVEPDDVVFRLTDLQNDKRSLRTGQVRERGIITSAYLAVEPTGIHPGYFNYLLRAYDLSKVFYSMGGGLRQSMKYDDVRRMPVVLPRAPEQAAITAFLDRETGKIEALVEEQRLLIELLKEKRQAVISHAVTKGLDPNAKMKPSSVEWLGDVPEHWEVVAVKRHCVLLKDGTHLPPARVADGVPLLSVRNVQDGHFAFREDDSMISETDYQSLAAAFVPMEGDVVLAIVGATLGKSAIIMPGMERFHIQRSLALFRTAAGLSPTWLDLVFNSQGFQSLLWERVGFSAQPGIYLGTLGNLKIPVPPSTEQASIIGTIGGQIETIDALVFAARTAIDLLHERRASLISAAVTGKIDVREAAADQEHAA